MCDRLFTILKLLGKNTHTHTHTRKSYQQNRRWNFFYILCRCNSMLPTGKEGEHAKGRRGGQARSYPSRSPEIEGPGTHTQTHLGNVLLHTHHLFSHPFARETAERLHIDERFNRCYCEFTFPILLVVGLNLSSVFFSPKILWFFPIKN
jgi:hypothetical protein